MVALEKCPRGAYMYLAAREKRRSYEIVLLHLTVRQSGGKREEQRRSLVVACVKKYALKHLEAGNNRPRKGDSLVKSPVGSEPAE